MTRRPHHRPAQRGSQEPSPVTHVARTFLLMAVISLALTVFVLFMQREWRLSGVRTVVLVHMPESDVVRRKLTLVQLDQQQNQLTIVPLPPEQQVAIFNQPEVSFATDALYGYSQLEKKDSSWIRLQLALEYGVVVDGIIWTSDVTVTTKKEVMNNSWKTLVRQRPTSLTYWDRLIWWQSLRKVEDFAVGTPISLAEYVLPDTKELDFTRYDRWASQNVQDTQIRQTGMSVAVLNASGVQGQAQRFSRMLELIGYEVRSVDTIEPQEKTKILLAPPEEDQTASQEWTRQRMKDIFSSYQIKQDEEETEKRRSEAVIILGKDL